MKTYRIAVLRGDGIGPEIVNEAVKVLEKTAAVCGFEVTLTPALLGGAAIDETGVPLPEETIAVCKASDAVLLGAPNGTASRGATGPKRACWASGRPWVSMRTCALR